MPKKASVARGPLGLPVVHSYEDPQGYGDRAVPGVAFTPSGQAASVPHELSHAELQALEALIPGGLPLEALISKLSEHAYGDATQYQNPLERYAYGYQEAKTGQSDTGFQNSSTPEAVAKTPRGNTAMIVRNILDLLGSGTESAGRALGRR